MSEDNDIERKISERASSIFEGIKGEVPSFFDTRKWKGKMMEWAMKDERFKVQLFRFIDTLPSLKSDADVARLFA